MTTYPLTDAQQSDLRSALQESLDLGGDADDLMKTAAMWMAGIRLHGNTPPQDAMSPGEPE